MKKCLKCNSSLKESPHNQMTGYESYRCTNSDCRALFDISELSNLNISSKKTLIKPDKLNPYHNDYFDILVKSKKVHVPLGAGSGILLDRILNENKDSFAILANRVVLDNFLRNSQNQNEIKDRIFFIQSREFREFISSRKILKYNHCLLGDYYPNMLSRIVSMLTTNGFSLDNIYQLGTNP